MFKKYFEIQSRIHLCFIHIFYTPWFMFHGILKFPFYLSFHHIKFIFSKQATKFCEIFPLLLTLCNVVKSKGQISPSQNIWTLKKYPWRISFFHLRNFKNVPIYVHVSSCLFLYFLSKQDIKPGKQWHKDLKLLKMELAKQSHVLLALFSRYIQVSKTRLNLN